VVKVQAILSKFKLIDIAISWIVMMLRALLPTAQHSCLCQVVHGQAQTLQRSNLPNHTLHPNSNIYALGVITACTKKGLFLSDQITGNTWAWCLTKISIRPLRLRPFTAGTFRAKKFVQENVLTNRLHAHQAPQNLIPASMYASQIWSAPFLQQGEEIDNPVQKWPLTVYCQTSFPC
jgi:hypothetical protein